MKFTTAEQTEMRMALLLRIAQMKKFLGMENTLAEDQDYSNRLAKALSALSKMHGIYEGETFDNGQDHSEAG